MKPRKRKMKMAPRKVLGTTQHSMAGVSTSTPACCPSTSTPASMASQAYRVTGNLARPATATSSPMPYAHAYAAASHAQRAPVTASPITNHPGSQQAARSPPAPKGPWATPEAAVDPKARELWARIAKDGHAVSLDQLRAATERDEEVAELVERCGVLNGAGRGDAVSQAFEAMADGKRGVEWSGFEAQARLLAAVDRMPLRGAPRSSKRVLIISAGFGRLMRPMQSQMVEAAGFQIHWCTKPPNPEIPNFRMAPHLQQIKAEIDEFGPDLVVCASKGGAYAVALWEAGLWLGPTLMINAHPSCTRLPKGAPVVVAAGADDEHYPTTRQRVDWLQSTGTRSHCLTYFASGTGRPTPGHACRMGDRHNMDTLLSADCLPRLMDAAMCRDGPEVHMARTCVDRLSHGRVRAENALRDQLLERWDSAASGGAAQQLLTEVAADSEEFRNVTAVFSAKEASAYQFPSRVQQPWGQAPIAGVQRVEPSGAQAVGGAGPQATQQGPWGTGTYFARDAKYVSDSGLCRNADGSKTVLLCLLSSGMSCQADPNGAGGALPRRRGAHHYQCSASPQGC